MKTVATTRARRSAGKTAPAAADAEIAEVREALAVARRELAHANAHADQLAFSNDQRAATDREALRKLLHDGLGQILTSATFLASGLRQRLATLGLPEREIVEELVLLLNQAIAESRTLATRCEPPSESKSTSTQLGC